MATKSKAYRGGKVTAKMLSAAMKGGKKSAKTSSGSKGKGGNPNDHK